ncbi:threonylcarbamoyl-AMP synthase [Paenibacillus thermoaerophilus]|nr:threonylcarbamoyl-AMP synthase [Paenibacillus thermoaerophilus]
MEGSSTKPTICWQIGDYDPRDPLTQEALAEAGRLVRGGGLVAFPTETVYGLGADARNSAAVRRIFEAKGRPSDNPLIVHVANREGAAAVARTDDPAVSALMEAFWPGPLTLVLPAREGAVAPEVTAGLPTVAVRVPDHPVALALIRSAGCPIAAPSANRSGRPSPTNAAHVREDLDGRIGGIVDGGPTGVGVESTVVEPIPGGVRILRPGGVTAEQLAAVAGRVELDPALQKEGPEDAAAAERFAPRSPGMKYTHYAPQGRLAIVEAKDGDPRQAAEYIRRELEAARARGEKTGILTVAEHAPWYEASADVVSVAGTLADPSSVARGLFAALRRFDEEGATFMLAESFPEHGIGQAVMNRLTKAAGGTRLRV